MQSVQNWFPFTARVTGLATGLCFVLGIAARLLGGSLPGELIALTLADQPDSASRLYLMDSRATLVARISDEPVNCCVLWSPDGTRIAFTGIGGRILIWSLRDGEMQTLTLDEMVPALVGWSPDGESLLLTNRRGDVGYAELYRVAISTGQLAQLIATNDPFKRIDFAQWSPDGQFIVFALGTSYITRLWDIYRIDADGGEMQLLSDGEGISYGPQLSPDGEQIAFVVGSIVNNDIYLMNADGSSPRRLTATDSSERMPVWSPDGTQILFQSFIDPSYPRALDVINRDGTGRRRLADDSAFNDVPSWSPDGHKILYDVRGDRAAALYVMDADGGNVRLLLRAASGAPLNAAWQPAS